MNMPHRVLPPQAQRELRAAATTPITKCDPLAREKAINLAVRRIKQRYPYLFKQEVLP